MPESPQPQTPRNNPFWTYRDPRSGRWVTLMTAAQCQQVKSQVFSPKIRQSASEEQDDPNQCDQSAS